MTLCIAAACWHEGQSAVVTCADWQITAPGFAAEDYYKLRHYPNATVMISGDLGAADEFCFDLHEVIRDFNLIARTNGELETRINQYLDRLRQAAQNRKRLRAEHQMAMKYAISLDRFYKKGSKLMPNEIYKKILKEIQQIKLDVSTIIIFSGESELLILHTGPMGGAFWRRNYVTIGSGALIAETVLCNSPHDKNMPLLDCLMRVVSAKTAAERDPYVGRNTSLGIILGDGSRYDISDEGWAYLMHKIRVSIIPATDDGQHVPVLGIRLSEAETGKGRRTADPGAAPPATNG